MTAPVGAVLASLLGPLLLTRDIVDNDTCENPEETDTTVKSPHLNYGSCHQLQPSDILPPKAAE